MRPSTPRRERILAYGSPGAGKTRAWLSIADLYVKTNSPGKFYVIDTDDTYWASVEEFPKVAEAEIVETLSVYDWTAMTDAAKEFAAKAGPDDWIVCDLFDKGWEEVQNYYSEQAFGQDKGDFFLDLKRRLEASKKTKGDQPGFEGWTDWTTIKALHARWANNVLYRHKAHVFLATSSKAISRKTDKKDIIQAFGHIGAKPAGEKGLAAHGVNTVMMLSQAKTGEEWTMDTAKDRGGREPQLNVRLHGFGMDYLVKVGGWKLK